MAVKAPSAPRSTAAHRQVANELQVYAGMLALGLSTADPVCAPVLNDQSKAIADALATLICRNPKLVEWVHQTGLVGDWLKLFQALWPVLVVVRDHHMVKKVDPEGGPGGAVEDYSRYQPYRPGS